MKSGGNIFTLIMMNILLMSTSFAQQFSVIPNVFFSNRNFEYSVPNGNVSGSISSLGGGITGIYQHFYIDLSGERNLNTNEKSVIDGLYNTIKFERTDFAASAGYAINESISTFLGYKYGKSTLTELFPSPFAGEKTSLKGKGWFVGAGGGWPVRTWGTFSFSAAYAKMIADYNSFASASAEGEASGTSLGIKWKAPVGKHLYYDLSLIRHDYYYENFDKIDFDISEQILSFRLGLSYHFWNG